jgi:chemotaxis protein MotB
MADDKEQPIVIKKIKKGGHGHHGGAWKLAYADFVTAMMAFFLVMWIIGLDFKTKNGLAEYFQNPGAFKINFKSSSYVMNMDGKPPADMALAEPSARENHNVDIKSAEGLMSLINAAIRNEPRVRDIARRVEVKMTTEGVKIEFLEGEGGTFFESGTANLKTNAQRIFQTIAPILIGSKKTLELEGHTDSTKLKDLKYTSWELSADRANAVRRSLYAVGVPESQIVSVNAKADRYLKRAESPQSPENNRVVILIPVTTQ